MSKLDPSTLGKPLSLTTSLEDEIDSLMKRVEDDRQALSSWRTKQTFYYERRYQRSFRGTSNPWPGAADIVMPLMDMLIDRNKSTYMRSVFGVRPIAHMASMELQDTPKLPAAEYAFDSLVRFKITDFPRQIANASDLMMQHGLGIVKIIYDYRTRVVTEVLDRDRWPWILREILGGVEDAKTADKIFRSTRIPSLTKQDLRDSKEKIIPIIRQLFH